MVLGATGHHIEAAKKWGKMLDIIGVASYPNVFEPMPIQPEVVGKVVAEIKRAVPRKAVYVLETGYAVQYAMPSQSGAYYTEEQQAEFVKGAFNSAREAGAAAFFVAGVWSDESLHDH